MSYGLQVYKSNGVLQLSVTDRLTKVVSVSTHVLAGNSNVTVAVPAEISKHTNWTVWATSSGASDYYKGVPGYFYKSGSNVVVYPKNGTGTVTLTVRFIAY